jgi:hypothetical protein
LGICDGRVVEEIHKLIPSSAVHGDRETGVTGEGEKPLEACEVAGRDAFYVELQRRLTAAVQPNAIPGEAVISDAPRLPTRTILRGGPACTGCRLHCPEDKMIANGVLECMVPRHRCINLRH